MKSAENAEYPPPPWHMHGTLWGAFFPTSTKLNLPADLTLLAPRALAVLLIRYHEGTLSYDELMIGPLARLGRRIGVHAEFIWVNDEQSLRGGQSIWGVPKRLAEFQWSGSQVRVNDHEGTVAHLTAQTNGPRLPRIPLPLAGFGSLDDSRTVITSRFSARAARASIHAHEWSPRLPTLQRNSTRRGFAATPFTIDIPAPLLPHDIP